jgi:DNA-binding transcriptional ArsR family regulator
VVDVTTVNTSELLDLSPTRARVRSTIAAAISQPEDLRQLRIFHKAMADVNRLRIVRRLVTGTATVAELTAHVGLSQPLVSWHIGRLRAAGVVVTTRNGRETVCRLRPEAFDEFAAQERAALGFAG